MTEGVKSVTLRDLTDAIEKNGIPHITARMWDTYSKANPDGSFTTVIRGGCAMAQGIMNLGVGESFFGIMQDQIGEAVVRHAIEHPEVFGNDAERSTVIGDRIVYLNDHKQLTLKQIADRLRTEYEPFMGVTIFNVPTTEYEIDPNAMVTPEQAEKELTIAATT